MEIRTHRGGWAVFAQWFGEKRIVFGPASIWKCIEFRAEQNG